MEGICKFVLVSDLRRARGRWQWAAKKTCKINQNRFILHVFIVSPFLFVLVVSLRRPSNLKIGPLVLSGLYLTKLQLDDPVADVADHRQVMGDKQYSQAPLFLQSSEKMDDLSLRGNIQ